MIFNTIIALFLLKIFSNTLNTNEKTKELIRNTIIKEINNKSIFMISGK